MRLLLCTEIGRNYGSVLSGTCASAQAGARGPAKVWSFSDRSPACVLAGHSICSTPYWPHRWDSRLVMPPDKRTLSISWPASPVANEVTDYNMTDG